MPDLWVTVDVGEYIYSVVDRALFVSQLIGVDVRFVFNEIQICVKPTHTRDAIFLEYMNSTIPKDML